MKKKRIIIPCLLALPALLLSGCSNSQTADAYGLNTGNSLKLGYLVYHQHATLSSGNLTSFSMEETYSPAVWARVDPTSKTDSGIETIEATDVTLFDGTKGTVQYAKHIKIGEYTLTGSLRDEDEESSLVEKGEVVKYTFDSTSFSVNDLVSFLAIDSTTYRLGPNGEWYFDAVMNDDIHLLGYDKNNAPVASSSSSSSESSSDDSSSSVSSSASYSYDSNYYYAPSFPEDQKIFNKASNRSDYDSTFTTLSAFFVTLKQLDYVYRSTDTNNVEYKCIKTDTSKGTYIYNPGYSQGVFSDDNWVDTGVKTSLIALDTIKAYFESASYAYASQEYNSKK